MRAKYFFLTLMIVLVCSLTSCNYLRFVDTKEEALEQRRTIGPFSDSMIVQEITLNDRTFVLIAPPESEDNGDSGGFAVGQIVQKNNGSNFFWYHTTSDYYIDIPGGGAIPIKAYSNEDFMLALEPTEEGIQIRHDQISAKSEDTVSDIYEFKGTYFFLKSGANVY